MSELPTGTLTMLFTDVEGSTRILTRLGSRYAEVVSAQRAVVRACVERWGGSELGTEGDSFFVVFRSARDGLSAARDAQRELARTRWPDGVEVRVRMGLHTGEPTRHEDGYVGLDVHRAARVAASAHGGQVLLTGSTHRLVAGQPPEGVTFRDLGHHRLKDLPHPEHLHQLCIAGLPDTFPPARSLGSAAGLPQPVTSLVGRDRDVTELVDLLRRPGVRLVTLTGPAGTGKTRLALAAASTLVDGTDEVYFVPLAPVEDAAVLWTTLADVLGVVGESKDPPTILEHLAQRRALLVLDNLEQVTGAGEAVAELLGGAPDLAVLATSRRPLHVPGEHEVPVLPLPVEEAGPGSAVDLFVERARLVRPSFTLDETTRADVLEICRALDGLPLAVELVAARSKLLGPRALRNRLGEALELTRPDVGVPARQHTLRAALDWSHRLLPEDLRRTFRSLGVCEGEVDLAAAAAVTGREDVLDDVAELVDASLVAVRDGPDGEPRVRLLRTVARYARDQLRAAGELDAVAARHAAFYADRARRAAARLRGPDHLAARDALVQDLPDLRAALAWSLDAAHPDRLGTGLGLCEHLSWFWYGCGYQAEGRRWLQEGVSLAGGHRSPEVLAALQGLGVLVLQHGQADRARELLEVCARDAQHDGDESRASSALNSLAMAHRALGDAGEARRCLDEALGLAEACGDRRREANAVSNLAILALDAGEPGRAIDLLRRVLELDIALEDTWGQSADHVNLAGALLRAGRLDEAHAHLREHAAGAIALGDVELTVDVLGLLCAVHAMRGDAGRAARLLGATERMREQAELPLAPPDAAWFDTVLAQVRDRPDAETWSADVAAGGAHSVESALADGLAG